MKKVWIAGFLAMMLFACNKKEPATDQKNGTPAAEVDAVDSGCSKEMITDKPVKAGETGIVLPAGTKLCFTPDNLEIRVSLPADYAFVGQGENKTLPAYATYSCTCSQSGSHCQVFYADGMGFGCLQSTCTGSCTGRFTYRGYTVDKLVPTTDKESFFQLPEVQQVVRQLSTDQDYEKTSVFGVPFYLVNNEKIFLPKASCDCDGTAACKLKAISIPLGPKVYFCEGSCNGCELTVN
jgi:hypothetical protein